MKYFKLTFIIFLIFISVALFSCDNSCKHEFDSTVIDPTCTDDGKMVKVCKICDEVEETVLPASGHTLTSSVTDPTCRLAGYTEYKCDCGYSYKTDIVSAKGHKYAAETTKPTCSDSGYTTYSCKNCASSYVADVTKPLGHKLTYVVTAPSCVYQGYTAYSCSACDYSFKSDYVEPTGHNYLVDSITVTAPTCTEKGFSTYSCSECDYSYDSNFTDPTGHNYIPETLSFVSCTNVGEVKYTCSCGDNYTELITPSGHNFEEKVTNPTVSDMGYTEYTCECGFSYVGNYRFYSEILDNAYAGTDQVFSRGIDISKWNHTQNSDGKYEPIDWVALKEAGVDYVILKIGSTPRNGGADGGLEPTFEMDYEGAKAAGIDVGVYFFTYAKSVIEIKKDAGLLLTWLDGKQFEYPIYLDIEDVPNEDYYPSEIASPILTEMCLTFFSTLQKEGYYTGLYVNNEFLFNILQTDNMIELFEIWYARYPSLDPFDWNAEDSESYVWNTEKYGDHLGMWQYCMTGKLPPIVGDVDFNFAYKEYPTLIKKHGFNGFSANIPDNELEEEPILIE